MKIVADQNIPFVKECFSSLGEVHLCSGRQFTPHLVSNADALLVRSITRVDKALLHHSSVKFVGTATIGTDHIDQEYLAGANIEFASAPGSNANSVAEWVTAALLALGRKHSITLKGKSIGIVGVGNVGSKVVKKCIELGMETILNDPPLQRETNDSKYRSLDEALACDFVTMHTPLTFDGRDKTHHLADQTFFDRMKPNAFFFNSSRGGVHNTQGLTDALKQKKIAGFVLDVWENEPNVDEFLMLNAELSTPHIAGYSFDGKVKGMMMLYEALCRHFDITAQHKIEDFLPEPEVPEIRIDPAQTDEQAAMHDVVQQVYNISRDDLNMREILTIPNEQRAGGFDDLRKNYHRRREFQNTTVILPADMPAFSACLKGIGFKVAFA